MNNFKVIQSNPNQKGGFVTKLQREIITVDAIFGDKVKKETFYISGTKQVPVDTMVPASHIDNYRVEAHPGVNPSTGEEIMLNWLHCK